MGVLNEVDNLTKLCSPIVSYLKENYNLHTEIRITSDKIEVKQDILGIPDISNLANTKH